MSTLQQLSVCLSLVSLILLGACRAPEGNSFDSTIVPAPQGELPMIGMGYSSMDARVTGTNCFENLPVEINPAQQAELEFQRNMSADQLSKLMDAGIEIGFPVYPGMTVKGQARYAEEFASGRYAETMTLHFKAIGARSRVYFGDDTLGTLTNIKSTGRLDKLMKDSNLAAIQSMCGDRYVTAVEKGMEFIATLKMEFNNEFQKKAYAAGFGAEILGGIASVNVNASYEKILASSNVNVSLAIQQKGGAPVNLLSVIPSRDWADEALYGEPLNTEPILGDRPEKLVMDDLRSGITFLNCSFETRGACYAIFRHISQLAQGLSAQVKNDEVGASQLFEDGNLVPISIQTSAYPDSYGMDKVALGHDQDEIIQERFRRTNELRIRLLEVYKEAKEARRRAEGIDLNKENIRLLMGSDSPGAKEVLERYQLRSDRLNEIVAVADKILDEVENVEHECWDTKAMRLDSGIEACANGITIEGFPELSHHGVNGLAELTENGKLFIDSRDLIGDPESFTEWCYYAYAPGVSENPLPEIFDSADVLTVDALMALAQVEKPTDSSMLLNQCYSADTHLAQIIGENRGVLNLSKIGIYSTRPIASLIGPSGARITSLDLSSNMIIDIAPLAKLKSLTYLNLDKNRLKTLAGLESVQPQSGAYSSVSVSGNQISSGVGSVLNHPKFKWNSVRLGKNPIVQISQPVKSSTLTSLDLRGGVIGDVRGLATMTSPFQLDVCVNRVTKCPFDEMENLRCAFDKNPLVCLN